MKKKFFEDPEMEVVRFDPQDIYTAASGYHDSEDGGTVDEDDLDPEEE